MTNDNDKILEDLEATNADEVVGGGPQFSVTAMGQQASMQDNRDGGSTINAGDTEINTHDEDGSRGVTIERGDSERGASVQRDGNSTTVTHDI